MMIRYLIRKLIHTLFPSDNKAQMLMKYHVHIGNVVDRGINIRLDKPVANRVYLTIGDNCIIAGNFIFESKEGNITIGNHSYIGGGVFISHSSITIGNNVTIAWGVTLYDHDSHSLDYLERRKDIDDQLDDIRNARNFIENKNWDVVNSKPIVVKDDAWIGMNVIVLKGVTIGRGSIIGAGSVVTHDIPDWSIAAGNPARVVKHLNNSLRHDC